MPKEKCGKCKELKAELSEAKKRLREDGKAADKSIAALGEELERLGRALKDSETLCTKNAKKAEAAESSLHMTRGMLKTARENTRGAKATANGIAQRAAALEKQQEGLVKQRDEAVEIRQEAIKRRDEALADEAACQTRMRGLEAEIAELRQSLQFKDACK
jgi:chromosome segregation ATPase